LSREDIQKFKMIKICRRHFRKITLRFCPSVNPKDPKVPLICRLCHHLGLYTIEALLHSII
jgi:hypothetical protein